MVGTEIRVADVVPVRLGWFRDGVEDKRWATAGMGVENESVGLSYGLQMDFWSEVQTAHRHALMLRISM